MKISLSLGLDILLLALIMSVAFVYGMYQNSLAGSRLIDAQYKIHKQIQQEARNE